MRPSLHRACAVLLACAVLFLCAGCSSPRARRAFYYWKSQSPPSAEETAILERMRVARLYLRLFDLDVTGAPAAALPLTHDAARALGAVAGREIVPVVYVVPEALRNRGVTAAQALGARTAREILARCASAGITPLEVQVDYDWTARTREEYFGFLAGVREGLEAGGAEKKVTGGGEGARGARLALSATIRLHQVRDRKAMGVPPVDRGLLMAYNLSAPADPAVRNSILDMDVLRPYLDDLPGYPLELDVALPCFSWAVHFENRRVLGLIPLTEAGPALADGIALRAGADGWWEARARTYVAGRAVEPGDRLRVEKVDPPLVLAEARAIAARLPRGRRTIAFFSLDRDAVEMFSGGSHEAFDRIYSALGAGAAAGP